MAKGSATHRATAFTDTDKATIAGERAHAAEMAKLRRPAGARCSRRPHRQPGSYEHNMTLSRQCRGGCGAVRLVPIATASAPLASAIWPVGSNATEDGARSTAAWAGVAVKGAGEQEHRARQLPKDDEGEVGSLRRSRSRHDATMAFNRLAHPSPQEPPCPGLLITAYREIKIPTRSLTLLATPPGEIRSAPSLPRTPGATFERA